MAAPDQQQRIIPPIRCDAAGKNSYPLCPTILWREGAAGRRRSAGSIEGLQPSGRPTHQNEVGPTMWIRKSDDAGLGILRIESLPVPLFSKW